MLTAIAIAASLALLWVFGRCSDQVAIREAKRKIGAYLLAFRLFADEPSQIFRAQGQLLKWNLRYLALMVRPAAITTLPLALLLFQLDACYGRRPLKAGESAIVTVKLAKQIDARMFQPKLDGRGIVVETPPVRLPDEGLICWRVRAPEAKAGSVELRFGGSVATKVVQAGDGLLYPRWERIGLKGIESITVDYPAARISVFGFAVHWLVWFCAVSLVVMLLFRKRLNVTF
jgi:hypothetical protein